MGSQPTDLEKTLLVITPPETMHPWVNLAHRIGAHNLVAFFDEFGGQTIHIPQRAMFFRRLQRAAQVQRAHLMHAAGSSTADIAADMGLSPRTVRDFLADGSTPETSGGHSKDAAVFNR